MRFKNIIRVCLFILFGFNFIAVKGQSNGSFFWLNQPSEPCFIGNDIIRLSIPEGSSLITIDTLSVTQTTGDFPFLYFERGGTFELSFKIEANLLSEGDEAGIMIMNSFKDYARAGIKRDNGENFTFASRSIPGNIGESLTTYSITQPDSFGVSFNTGNNQVSLGKDNYIWIKIRRDVNLLFVDYSLEGIEYVNFGNTGFSNFNPCKIGFYGISPDGKGFEETITEINFITSPKAK